MTFFDDLSKHFPPDRISWRVGATKADKTAGLALAYIDARDVMDRLDAVCGPENWQKKFSHAGVKTVCDIGIRVDNEWIWKADGAGDTDVEAEKGALSDAFKRAAVCWGIGRYLYDCKNTWVTLKKAGNSYAIDDGEFKKLENVLKSMAGSDTQKPAQPYDRNPIVKAKFAEIIKGVREQAEHGTLEDLTEYWLKNQDAVISMPADWKQLLIDEKETAKEKLKVTV